MEESDSNDVRLPPRKRLLAGLRRQSSESPPPPSPSPPPPSPSPSPVSYLSTGSPSSPLPPSPHSPLSYLSPPSPPSPSSPSHSPPSPLSEISPDISFRIRKIADSYSNLSLEEVVERSKLAAAKAVEVADKARAVAEEKAAVAAKARAFAKGALELVVASKKYHRKETPIRRGRPKKHVHVKVLYKKRKLAEKGETDEDVARRLHRAMNSSSRLTKSPKSLKFHKYMKIRKHLNLGKKKFPNGGLSWAVSSNNSTAKDDDLPRGESHVKTSEHAEVEVSEMGGHSADGEAEALVMVQALEDKMKATRKRGRIRQKKLSLSLCTIRDLKNSKEEQVLKALPSKEEPTVECTVADLPVSSGFPSADCEMAVETLSSWKYKGLNAAQCSSGTNILHSLCSTPTITTGTTMVEVDQ